MTIDEIHVGDPVVVRDWDDMAGEYGGTDVSIDIANECISFVCDMREYCGRETVVTEIIQNGRRPRVRLEGIGIWAWSPGMLRRPESQIPEVSTDDFLALLC